MVLSVKVEEDACPRKMENKESKDVEAWRM